MRVLSKNTYEYPKIYKRGVGRSLKYLDTSYEMRAMYSGFLIVIFTNGIYMYPDNNPYDNTEYYICYR
jgi:hypothetical protein